MACENADVPAVFLSQSDAEAAVFCLINERRVDNNVPPLTLNRILRNVAREQAMAAAVLKWWPDGGDTGHVPHVNPVTHKDEQVRIEEAGYCPSDPAGVPRNENAYTAHFTGDPSTWGLKTTPAAAVEWWMSSDGHRTTLLDPAYRETGVGVVRGTANPGLPPGSDGAIFLQDFGGCSEIDPLVDTQLWAWGANAHGAVGDGSGDFPQLAPVHPAEFEGFEVVAASHHSVAVKSDGTVWTWGPRQNKGPIDGGSRVPVKVPDLDQVTTVAAGYEHNLAIKSDGTVWAWGDNRGGQLGDGSGHDQEIPVQVRGLAGVKAVAAGREHSLALLQDGTIMAWGSNNYGQLGTGTDSLPYPEHRFPFRVPGLRATAIAAGEWHSLAIEEHSGQLWLWGYNIAGCLGSLLPPIPLPPHSPPAPGPLPLSQMTDKPRTPTPGDDAPGHPFSGFTGRDIRAAACGFDTTYAVDSHGNVWAWGDNSFDQFGPGTSAVSQDYIAYKVGLTDVVELAAGEYHCLALKRDGTLWSWGSNATGQLGQGVVAGPDQPPGPVSGLDHVTSFSAGNGHSLAIAHREG